MSIKFIDELIMDIYLKKELINNINFKNKSELEIYLKKLFKILKYKYKIELYGFYDITAYIDKYYGIVLHIEKNDIDYYDYFKNQVDMKLIIIDTEFLYEVEDIPEEIINKVDICILDNNIYLKLKNKLSNKEMMKLLEYSNLVYNK